MRGLLGTDRPRVVSVTAEPNKSEAGAYLAGISVATPSRRITIVLFNAEANRAGQVIFGRSPERPAACTGGPTP